MSQRPDEHLDEDREAGIPPEGAARDSADETAERADDFDAEERPSVDVVAETAREFLEGLIASLGLEGEVTTSVEGESALVDVTGDAMGLLIGRRGQTLEALQELTRTAVQRRLRARVRLMLDVEGYRARRRTSLAQYAKAMAERAKSRGTEIELEPMPAFDRKIVHDAVAEVAGASSFSEGAEPNRKVIIRGE
jgi:spoIIIJ-associated protein